MKRHGLRTDITELKKEQAKILRAKGMGYGRIGFWTGLQKHIVQYAVREIEPPPEDGDLDRRLKEGEACLYCGSEIPKQKRSGRHRRFCCETCRRAYWKIHRAEVQKKPKSMYTHTCVYCGKIFEVYGKVERKYCSRHCYMLHRHGHQQIDEGVAV